MATSLAFVGFSADAIPLDSPTGSTVPLGVSAVFLILFGLWLTVRQWQMQRGIRETRADLATLAQDYDCFHWPEIETRIVQALEAYSAAWRSDRFRSARSSLTVEFYNSQKKLQEEYREAGRRKIFEVLELDAISPLALSVEDDRRYSHLRILLEGQLIDFEEEARTGEHLAGERNRRSSVRRVLEFLYDQDDQWRLHGITDGSSALDLARQPNQTDTTWLDSERETLELDRRALSAIKESVRTA